MTGPEDASTWLDTGRIHTRLHELGLGPRDVSVLAGISLGHLARVDTTTLSVEVLLRLARALRLAPGELLIPPRPAPVPPPPGGTAHDVDGVSRHARRAGIPDDIDPDHDDAQAVESLLTWAGTLDHDELADALSWPADRVRRALDRLASLLTGHRALVVTDHDARIAVRDGPLRIAVTRLQARRRANRPLTPYEATSLLELVADILLGAVRPLPRPDAPVPWPVSEHHDQLITRRLAAPVPQLDVDTRRAPRPMHDVAVHPDVLFALGLAATPAPDDHDTPIRDGDDPLHAQ